MLQAINADIFNYTKRLISERVAKVLNPYYLNDGSYYDISILKFTIYKAVMFSR